MIREMSMPDLRGFVPEEDVEHLQRMSMYVYGFFSITFAVGLGIIAYEYWI